MRSSIRSLRFAKSIDRELDALVFAEIQQLLAGKPSDLHLTIPDIIDPEETHEIGYFGTVSIPVQSKAMPS